LERAAFVRAALDGMRMGKASRTVRGFRRRSFFYASRVGRASRGLSSRTFFDAEKNLVMRLIA
jgi:hypothetical protein